MLKEKLLKENLRTGKMESEVTALRKLLGQGKLPKFQDVKKEKEEPSNA